MSCRYQMQLLISDCSESERTPDSHVSPSNAASYWMEACFATTPTVPTRCLISVPFVRLGTGAQQRTGAVRQLVLCRIPSHAVVRRRRRTTTGDGMMREFAELAWRNRTVGDWAERLKRGQFGALGRRRAAVHLESIVGQPSIQKAAWHHSCA